MKQRMAGEQTVSNYCCSAVTRVTLGTVGLGLRIRPHASPIRTLPGWASVCGHVGHLHFLLWLLEERGGGEGGIISAVELASMPGSSLLELLYCTPRSSEAIRDFFWGVLGWEY